MRGCRDASGSHRQLQALAFLLSITATLGLKQTVQLYRKNASLDSNPQRRLTNVLYYGTMQLGTPGQEITICPDTGSAAIWTSADATPPAASGNSAIAPAYNGFVSNASSSYQLVSYGFAEKYNSGGVIGVLASDRVQLGDIVVGNASLGLVTEASVDLMGASCAGVLGLGRPGLAVRPGTAIFYRMLGEQGLFDVPSFSLWLNPDPAAEPAGSLTFGGIDATRYTGALTNVSVISSKYWMVPLLGVQAGGVSLPITARGAILDSSSAFSLVTDKDFLIFESLPGVSYSRQTGSFQVIGGCANITALPNLTVSLGTRNFTLTPQNYVVQVSGTACALGFQPGAPDNTVVLGTGFLRAYFTAYTYNATSRSSYVSLAPAAPGNSTTARRRAQELGGYPGGAGQNAAGPQPVSVSSAATSANALGGAADQDALLAATLAAQAAASAPTPTPAVAATAAAAPPTEASPPSDSAAPAPAPEAAAAGAPTPAPSVTPVTQGITTTNAELFPQLVPSPPVQPPAPAPAAATVPAPTPRPYVAPARQGINNTNAELFPELVPSPPVQPPAPAPAAASVPAPTPPPYVVPARQGINNTNVELFPELVPSPPAQPAAPALAPVAAPAQAVPLAEAPAVAPAPEAVLSAAAPAPEPATAAASGPAAAGPLPATLPVPVIPVAALEAPAPAPVATQPAQASEEAPAQAPVSAPLAAPAAAPEEQPADVAIPVTPLAAAPAPAPAEEVASSGAPAPAESAAVASDSLAAPTPAPAPSAEPADIAIPVTPLTAAPLSAPAPAPDAEAVAAVAAPGPGMNSASLPVPAPAPAPVPMLQPANIIIPVTMLSAATVSAPAPARAAARAIAAAPAPARAATGPVAAYSLRPPARAAAPARAPGRAPAPAPSRAAAPKAAISGAGAPQPGALKRPVKGPVPAPRGAPMRAPAMAPAASKKRAAAPAPAPVRSAAPARAPAAGAAVGAAAAPAVMPNSIAPFLAPAPAPLAAAPMSDRGPFGALFPTGAGNASDMQPPFQAIPGLEVLYGGLGSLWRLPLQLSSLNDTLFSSYLAAHPLTARQNRTLAKPRPPTPPGFGQPVNLVKLTDFMDTCVVGWSSVNSCIAKGINGTTCALMPFFDDVATLPYQCPYKNETQVEVPAGSGNFVPINQQWLLVRPGARGQQIYNIGLGKCLDICNDKAAASLCGHAGNVYLQDCDSTSATQQWLLNSVALANATVGSALNRGDLAAYQISNAYVPPVATEAFGAAPINQTCIDTCEAERDAQIMPSAYGETTCNNLLPTYPSSATAFPCNAQRLPHSIAQGFAIVFAPQPQSA